MDAYDSRHRDALEQALIELTTAVEELGLTAAVTGPLKLSVSGETPCPEQAEPLADALLGLVRPLSQDVTIECHGGLLWWCWVWNGPDRGLYESEPILPIGEVTEVARRLRRVVSLSPTG